MNKQRILELADIIENGALPGVSFDLGHWFIKEHHTCGAAACIAGYEYCRITPLDRRYEDDPVEEAARESLGLTWEVADALFMPSPPMLRSEESYTYGAVTPAQAAQTLRTLAETGEVNWKHVDPDYVIVARVK